MVVLIFGLGLMFLGYYVVKFGVHFYKDSSRTVVSILGKAKKPVMTVGDYIVIGTILFVGVLMIVLGLGFIFI